VDDKTITMHAGHTYRFTLGTSGSGGTIRPVGWLQLRRAGVVSL
jgi:hypothetical protein